MATIRGTITDGTSGEPAACTVHVLSADGRFIHPEGAVLKVGPGTPAFYCAGSFEVSVPTGGVRVLVERGTEYVPLERNLTVTETQSVDLELPLRRWTHLTERGWYPGNTHIHYDEKEQQRDHRLELEGHVHDFSVTVVSVLRRWDLDYASNHFPIGVMTDLTTAHHVVDIGEENRHNFRGGRRQRPWNRLRARHVSAHPQPGGTGQPRHAGGQPGPRLPADLLRLRRCAGAGRHRPLVPQRARPGGAGRRRAGQAGRLQPVRSVLDGSRVRDLVSAAQLRHRAAGEHRFRLVRVLQQPGLRRHRRRRIRLRSLAGRAEGRSHLHHQRSGAVAARRRRCPGRHPGGAARARAGGGSGALPAIIG